MSENQLQVQQAYEAYTREILQMMVNYIDGNPEVDRIWLYTDLNNDTIQTYPFFRFRGQFLDHNDIAEADDSHEYDVWALMDELAAAPTQVELLRACRGLGERPDRIITVYDPQEGELSSEWHYTEDVLVGPDDNYGRALDRWITSMGGEPVFGGN